MARVRALAMIGQHFDNAALVDPAMAAPFNHQVQFSLQRRQAANALFDLRQASLRNAIGGRTGLRGVILQSEQRPDGFNFKPKLAGMANEHQTTEVSSVIAAPIAFGAG